MKIEHWRSQGEDIVAVVIALGLERLLGVGHSMGGHAVVDAGGQERRIGCSSPGCWMTISGMASCCAMEPSPEHPPGLLHLAHLAGAGGGVSQGQGRER